MKSTAEASFVAASALLSASSGFLGSVIPSHTSKVSPVVTGTGLWRLTRRMIPIRSSTDLSARSIVSLPTTIALILL